MYYLDKPGKKMEIVLAGAVTANQLEITAHYFWHLPQETTTLRRGADKNTTSNNTTDVTIVDAPVLQGHIVNVHSITIHNKDTAPATPTVKIDDNGTESILMKQAIGTGESLVYEDGAGWQLLSPVTAPFVDSTAIIKGSDDTSKLLRIEVDGLPTGTTRVWTAADANIKPAGHATGLTAARIPYASGATGGVLTDSADLNFTGSVLLVGHTAALGRLAQSFEITTSANFGGQAINTFSATTSEAGVIDFNRSKSATKGTQTVVASGDVLGYIIFRGSDGTGFINAARIHATSDGTPGTNDMPGALILSTTADAGSNVTEFLRGDRNQCVGINNTDPSATARLAVDESNTSRNAATVTHSGTTGDTGVLHVSATNSAFAALITTITTNTVSGTGFDFLRAIADSDGTPDIEFRLRGDGTSLQDGGTAWSSPADYAEFFESGDGEIPVGHTVVLDGDKVRQAKSTDNPEDIIGVSRPKSGAGSIVANAGDLRWTGKYMRDEYREYIMEDYKVYEWEKDGVKHSHADYKMPKGVKPPKGAKVTVQQKRKLNPAFDPSVPYVPRRKRPEWVLVGLVGQVEITQGQSVNPRWRKMKSLSANVEQWFIR